MRLVYCSHCSTLEEIPDETGAKVDPYLEGVVLAHNERDPMAHGGARLKASPIRIFKVDDEEWKTKRQKVIDHVNELNKKMGMTAWVDESFNTYQEDALKCFRVHGRPAEGCIDYKNDSKRIGRPTKEGQAFIKENYKKGIEDPHICDFCPVHSWVEMKQRYQAGMYKES